MKKIQNPYKGKASRVLRALLSEPKRNWKDVELAQELGLAQAWVTQVLANLAQERLLQKGGRGAHNPGTTLLNPAELLRRWTTYYSFQKNNLHLYLVQSKDPLKYLGRVAKKMGAQYALTGYEAANLIRPGLMHKAVPMTYFWPQQEDGASYRAALAELEDTYAFIPVLKKANLILVEPYLKEEVFWGAQKQKGIPMVSPLQLFLDLYTMSPEKFVVQELANYWKKNYIPYEL